MSTTLPNELWRSLWNAVEKELSAGPGCHDFEHTKRVIRNAEEISRSERPESPDAVRIGALLHDIARPEELASGGKLCHAQLGGAKAERILRECGCRDEALLHLVPEIVRSHRFRGDTAPVSPEAKIVYDADKLDSLGAFGVARAFYFAGRIGARLHNTEEEALRSPSYSEQDSAYREYLVKLRILPDRMLTETGRLLARSRAEYMKDFFDRLNEEAFADLPAEI